MPGTLSNANVTQCHSQNLDPPPCLPQESPPALNIPSKAFPTPLPLAPIRHLTEHKVPRFRLLVHRRLLIGVFFKVETSITSLLGGERADEVWIFEREAGCRVDFCFCGEGCGHGEVTICFSGDRSGRGA